MKLDVHIVYLNFVQLIRFDASLRDYFHVGRSSRNDNGELSSVVRKAVNRRIGGSSGHRSRRLAAHPV